MSIDLLKDLYLTEPTTPITSIHSLVVGDVITNPVTGDMYEIDSIHKTEEALRVTKLLRLKDIKDFELVSEMFNIRV